MRRSGPLKRKTRLRAMSDKRRKASRKYTILRKKFLLDHPFCSCGSRSVDVHHSQGRGANYLNVSSWMASCRPCHDQIHQHPNQARKEGKLA